MPLLASPPPAWTGDVTQVTIVRRLDQEPAGYDRIWEPYLVEGPGDLIAAYGRKLYQKSDMGDLLVSHSEDHGRSWSEPVVVFDSRVPVGGRRYAYANTILFRPQGQDTVWLFGQRCPLYYSDSEDSDLCAAYSVDGGRSFQPVELSVAFHSHFIVVAGILELHDADGPRYLLPAHRNTVRWDPAHGDFQQFILESRDLLSWKLAAFIPQANPPRVFLHEGNLAPGLKSGEVEIVMRTAQPGAHVALNPPTAYSSVSEDGGRTWSLARPEPHLYNAISKGYYGTAGFGRHIYVYNNGPAWERKDLLYVVQSASGQWSAPRIFYAGNNHNSYPTLAEESPGHFLCIWDSATDPEKKRTAIRFGRLDLPPP